MIRKDRKSSKGVRRKKKVRLTIVPIAQVSDAVATHPSQQVPIVKL